jgi:hypothetical protein
MTNIGLCLQVLRCVQDKIRYGFSPPMGETPHFTGFYPTLAKSICVQVSSSSPRTHAFLNFFPTCFPCGTGWYRETTAWTYLSAATRRQRENIFAGVLKTAGAQPFAKISQATIMAGRESAHGLRKAAATRAANAGATVAELEAIFGWSGGTMAALYTRAADRRRLAKSAMHKLVPTLKRSEAAD